MKIKNDMIKKGIADVVPGTSEQIIQQSYTVFFEYFPDEKETHSDQWKKEDNNAFTQENIGKCVAFSCVDGQPVGYFSWDDRQFPVGIIGQNCILPEFRGQGYGYNQIEWIIAWFRELNFSEIIVKTGDHPFFFSSLRIYKNCGFTERGRTKSRLFDLIELNLK